MHFTKYMYIWVCFFVIGVILPIEKVNAIPSCEIVNGYEQDQIVSGGEPLSIETYPYIYHEFNLFNPKLEDFTLLDSQPINETYSVWVIEGMANWDYIRLIQGKIITPSNLVFKQHAFGVFVVKNTSTKFHSVIDIFDTLRFGDYEVKVDKVGKNVVEISGKGSSYGDAVFHKEYTFGLSKRIQLPTTLVNFKVQSQRNHDELAEILKANHRLTLKYMSEKERATKAIVLKAIRPGLQGILLEFASPALKDDEEVVTVAVSSHGHALRYASSRWRKNRAMVLRAVSVSGALQYASEKLQDDKEVVLAAVTKYGAALEYASDRLRNDPEVVWVAIKNSGYSLVYAPQKFQCDRKFVLAAIQAFSQLENTSEHFWHDKEILLATLEQGDIRAYYLLTEEMQADKDIAIAAIKIGVSLKDVPETLWKDPEVLMQYNESIAKGLYEEH